MPSCTYIRHSRQYCPCTCKLDAEDVLVGDVEQGLVFTKKTTELATQVHDADAVLESVVSGSTEHVRAGTELKKSSEALELAGIDDFETGRVDFDILALFEDGVYVHICRCIFISMLVFARVCKKGK